MRKLIFITECLLAEHSRKVFAHKGIKIGVAFACFEIVPPEKGEGNYNFEESLLIMNFVVDTVKGGYSFEKHFGGIFLKIWFARPSSSQVLVNQTKDSIFYTSNHRRLVTDSICDRVLNRWRCSNRREQSRYGEGYCPVEFDRHPLFFIVVEIDAVLGGKGTRSVLCWLFVHVLIIKCSNLKTANGMRLRRRREKTGYDLNATVAERSSRRKSISTNTFANSTIV